MQLIGAATRKLTQPGRPDLEHGGDENMLMERHNARFWAPIAVLATAVALAAAGCGSSSTTPSATNAARTTAPPRGYVNPKRTAGSPNTIYNHCRADIVNENTYSIKLVASDKYSHDDWVDYFGPKDLRDKWGLPTRLMTESGFARGCWWSAKWSDGYGSISIYVADPYSGHNEYHCTTTGEYRCYEQPYIRGFNDPQRLDGDYVLVNYKITRGDCRTCSPPAKYP